ncbi:MAG: hypothetical protein KF893_22765 [Caldilineaceae bacterium]|nr:hypothetical protein [Caldilineaceae bacterium]
MTEVDVVALRDLAVVEFADIVAYTSIRHVNELRIVLTDHSFLDVWFSLTIRDRYSYHWERRLIDGTIYRHDNAPDQNWQHVSTWPKHFHDGSQENTTESYISDDPATALREFLTFARTKLAQE